MTGPERQTVTAYLICDGAGRAIEFCKQVFGAIETLRLEMTDGRIGHAELTIGNSTIMLADEFPDMNIRGPHSVGGTPVTIGVEVVDTDAVVSRAVAAGATVVQAPADQFYGYRSAKIADPFGHVWGIMTNKEHLSNDEVRRRFEQMMKQGAPT